MKRGFTIVELLAVIVVLSVILLIAVPSITNLSLSIKKSNHDDVIKNIEIAAEKYAFDTNKEYVLVDTLIKEGYLRSDDNDEVIDPLDNQKLNCHLVKLTKVSDYYKASFSSEIYEVDGKCDIESLDSLNNNVYIEVYNEDEKVSLYDKWLKGSITLLAKSDNYEIDCKKDECLWQNNRGLSSNEDRIVIPNNESIINTTYNFQIKSSDSKKIYKSSINLKIDNESPTILIDNIKIPNEFIETEEKNIKIEATDGLGSGINGYFLKYVDTLNNGCDDATYTPNDTFKITTSGEYLICVIDNVGNVSSNVINIGNIGT